MIEPDLQQRTRTLARVFGPYFVVIGLMLATRQATLASLLPEFMQNGPLVLIAGAFTLLAGLALFGAHHHWSSPAAIAISLIGIGLVVSGGANGGTGHSTLAGNALILSSVLCWAFYSVGLRPVTERVDGITLSAVTMTGGIVPMVIVGAPSLLATKWASVSLLGWAAVGYSGLLALVVAYLFWYRGVRVLGATRAAMYSNLQPLVAMFAAWPLLGETPRALQLMGAACIVGGLLITRTAAPRSEAVHR